MLAALLVISISTIAHSSVNTNQKSDWLIYKSTSKDTTQPSAPRNGKYLISSNGSNSASPMKIGYFSLNKNEYIYYDLEGKQLGEGIYDYDAAEKQIRWQSGPFKAIGWDGNFEVENNGKTHTIRLKSTTVATNIID
jgi:hypothetical protein